MRASRLLSMLIHLQLHGRTAAARLAEAFEVSVRTVYRDVDALSAAGVPIYAEPGRNGGIALIDGYRTRLTGLTPAEAASLPLAGPGGQAGDLGFGAEAVAAHLKLLASLPADRSADARHVALRFHVDPIPWYHRAEEIRWLPALAETVWRDCQVRLDYDGWRGRTTSTVDPLGIVQKGGFWYLVAAVDGRPRTYRVANILRFEPLDTAFARPDGFDLAAYWSNRTEAFESDLAPCRATIRISEEGRRILRAANSAADAAVEASARPCRPHGWVEAEIGVEPPEYAARQLLRLGTDVQVIAPDALRLAIAREAARICDLYGEGRRPRRKR